MILIDTNILARVADLADPMCSVCRLALRVLAARRETLVIVPQNLYEFWVVATRASGTPPRGRNGLGMTPAQAGRWLDFFHRHFVLLPDREDLLPRWRALVEAAPVVGFRAHDARLAAAMLSYGIDRVLTLDHSGFHGLGVRALDPAEVKEAPPDAPASRV